MHIPCSDHDLGHARVQEDGTGLHHMRMHHDQRRVDAATVHRLLATQFPAWAGELVTPVRGSGTVNAIVRIGAQLVARPPLTGGPEETGTRLDAEAAATDEFALDLVCGWHLLDPAARAVLRSRLAVGDLEWSRGAAWAFEQALGLVWYYRDTNPVMAALGASTVNGLLAGVEVRRQSAST